MGDEKAIKEMIDSYCEAIRAGDARRALARLAPEAVLYELAPPLEMRGSVARDPKLLEEWLGTWDGPIEIELREPAIAVDGDLAYAYGLACMSGKKKKEGQVQLWYRLTICLRRQRGEWKVMHEHASVPFRMDGSEKAALDLKP